MRTLFFLFMLLLTSLPMKAQMGQLFDTDNQLSSNFVNQVFQDKKGYIWIATRNGLNVYDGYHFTVLYAEGKDNRGLTSSYVNCMSQDKDGHILLGTNNSLLRQRDDGNFENIPLLEESGKAASVYLNHILLRKNGDVVVSTSGYGAMLLHTGEKEAHQYGGSLKNIKHILKTFEDSQERLWIIGDNVRLLRLEKDGKLFSHFKGLEKASITDIKEDHEGNFYVSTRGQGIFCLKKGEQTFQHLDNIPALIAFHLFVSHSGKLCIGTDGRGLQVYDPKTGTLIDNPLFNNRTNLSKAKICSIIEDQQGNIWVGMLQKGVFMQPMNNLGFRYMGFRLGERNTIGENCVNNVSISRNGQMWIGTDKDGLYQLAPDGSLIKHHTRLPLTVMSLYEDQQGRMWVGSYEEGCGYIDASGNYHAFDLHVGGNVSVFDIKQDKRGTLWFATMGQGVIRMDKQGKLKQYKMSAHTENDPKADCLANDFIVKLALSKDHRHLWVATCIGLCCLDIEKGSWTSTAGINCLNRNVFSVSLMVDKQNRVWHATGQGVFCYNMKDLHHPKQYTIDNGLPSNGISSFAEDNQGRMWIGTNHGLCCLDPKTGKTANYHLENGLQSNEFSDRAACASPDGTTLLIGGTGGINWFDPSKVKQERWKAEVTVENTKFDFDYEDNSFSIRLTTLTYNNVEQISYLYSINGEEWTKLPAGTNEIAFSHLPAGTYKFRVKAQSNNQETPVKEFTITVRPAWYASIWAKIAYCLIAVLAVYLYLRYRKRKEQDRLLLQQHIHAEEMGEAKIRFFMNISHEIRTPLTLILTPLLTLIKSDKDPNRQGVYGIMRKNSERILHLINQLMDLRKIDKGQMVMHMSETDMVEFIEGEHELFHQQAKAKDIDFSFLHDSETLPVWIDRDNFDKVLMNVLSNAFKFTPKGGKITIQLTHNEQYASISIKDNGMGIPKDKLETIFQRFYQSPTTPNDSNMGTGIGLDLTRSLVELHYGTIIAKNNPDRGSEFIITLPLGNQHLKEEEMAEHTPLQKKEQETVEVMESTLQPVEEQSQGKPTIAIVEDDENISEYLQMQLSKDYQVVTYPNGKVALYEIIQHQPALIISDVMMPEMDGNTLCSKLKSNINTNHIPIILLTAKSREEDQLEGLEKGADAYMMKPFNMDILQRTIVNLLSVRNTLRNKFTGSESQADKVEQLEMSSPDDKLMERIMQVINENISDSDLSVDTIATKVGVSRVHLHRKMKELTNQTPHTFIRNVRLKQAAHLLRDKQQNVTEVMYACGFSNPASFSTMFKGLYGVSPREYGKG